MNHRSIAAEYVFFEKESDLAKFFDHIPEKMQTFIAQQHLFFVASAPLSGGRVNLSPKGLDTFRILSPTTVAYQDLTGSGNETAAHLKENGRLTFMFCGFEKQPMILRLYGEGRSINRNHKDWADFSAHFDLLPGTRQIIVMDIQSVQTSCGFAVPYYQFEGERKTLTDYAVKTGDEKLQEYWAKKNQTSIDGLPSPKLVPQD